MFKRLTALIIILTAFTAQSIFAQQSYTLKTGISVIDRVPNMLYGTWRVSSTRLSTNSQATFKPSTVDLWNLSREGNVLTLENPFSGAKASVEINEVNDRLIKFKKIGDFDGKKLTDIVELNLGKDSFEGVNTLLLETISDVDKTVIKSERATYKLIGEKIAGSSVK